MALRTASTRGALTVTVYGLGLIACFVGERLIGGQGTARWVISGLGAVSCLGASLTLLMAYIFSSGPVKKVEGLAFLLSLLGLVALALYVIDSDLVMGPAPVSRLGDQGPNLRQVLGVVWPILLLVSLLPLMFLQWSLGSMSGGQGLELGRVRASAAGGASLGILLCSLFLINASASEKDKFTDLSYFKTTTPSDSSRALVEGLDEDTQALLFFPLSNDVLAEVEPYFKQLASLSKHFSYRQVDRAMEPSLAEKYRVNHEGMVVLDRGGSNRKIDLGEDLDSAKRKLKKLDQNFQNTLLNLSFKREVIYLVTGHGERGTSRVEGDQRSRISLLKRGLEQSNFTVKSLDALGGLSQAVPQDAAMLLWVGPMSSLFPGESKALESYLDQGGRMLLLLDPEAKEQANEFLKHLGLKMDGTKLAHSKYFLPSGASRTKADQYNLITNKFSSHQATNTNSKYSRQLPVAMPTVGSLDRVKHPAHKYRITFLVRSMPNTWADADGDAQRSKEEPLKVFQLAAAISRKIKSAQHLKGKDSKSETDMKNDKDAKPGDTKDKVKEKKISKKQGDSSIVKPEKEMRVAVFADGDIFSDDYIQFRGNRFLLMDVFQWLMDERRLAATTSSEEDVKVKHTHDEDVWWFYSTVFAVPVFILILGFFTGWGRGRKRRMGR